MILIFTSLKKEREFYEKAVRLEGQNSFESIAKKCIEDILMEAIQTKKPKRQKTHPWLTPEHVAQFYSQVMCFVVISWIQNGMAVEPEEMTELYNYMMTRSMNQVIEEL